MSLSYIYTGFENGSPLDWEVTSDGLVHIRLLYDHERASPNRAAGHWHLQLHGHAGSELRIRFENLDNIWNGNPTSSPITERTHCFTSPDGRAWAAVPGRKTPDNCLEEIGRA